MFVHERNSVDSPVLNELCQVLYLNTTFPSRAAKRNVGLVGPKKLWEMLLPSQVSVFDLAGLLIFV